MINSKNKFDVGPTNNKRIYQANKFIPPIKKTDLGLVPAEQASSPEKTLNKEIFGRKVPTDEEKKDSF